MISKPVAASSFRHTCRYIAHKQGAQVLISEGVRTHDVKLMAADFELQQQLRPAKTMACFHSILSFHPREKPSDELMKEIAKKYLTELGITNTQFVITKHTDKAHLHLHLVANMVNNEGRTIKDNWIGLRGKKIAQKLTQEYKLIPALEKNLKITNLDALSQPEAAKYKICIAIAENLPHCKTMEDLEKRLLREGIDTQYKLKGHTQEKQGVSFRRDGLCFKGSQVDRKFSYTGLKNIIELQQKQILVQQQKSEKHQHLNLKKGEKNKIGKENSPVRVSEKDEKSITDILVKGAAITMDILMKAVDVGGPPQDDNSLKEALRKKRKQKHRHSY